MSALVLVQLFKPCCVGELIESGTDNLTRITFERNWIEDTKENKQLLMILNENLMVPTKFRVLSLFEFNFKTFTTVCIFL
jgi:hypothetical protein